MASSSSGSNDGKASESASSGQATTVGVVPERSGKQHEQPRRTLLSQESRTFAALHPHLTSHLPYPLNLPPSYPVYPSSPTIATARNQRPLQQRQSASISGSQFSNKIYGATEVNGRVWKAQSASSSKAKGKITLDTFMSSRRRTTAKRPDTFGSDSEVPLRHNLSRSHFDDRSLSDSSPFLSSSPPPSSPLQTPNESSPLRSMYDSALSLTTKRPSQPASSPSYVLPPGPYSHHKPAWSIAALIGQALNASQTGSLTVADIYSFVSTVYPYYDRADDSFMRTVRRNLSLQETFEKVPDEGVTDSMKGGKGKVKVGCWRIKPGHEHNACFLPRNIDKTDVKAVGLGLNCGHKRPSEDDGNHQDKRFKAEATQDVPSATPNSSTPTRLRHCSITNSNFSNVSPRRLMSHPSLTASQCTETSGTLLHRSSSPIPREHNSDDICSPGSPDVPLALAVAQRNGDENLALPSGSSLEPGFEFSQTSRLQSSPQLSVVGEPHIEGNGDVFPGGLASTPSARGSIPHAGLLTSLNRAPLLSSPSSLPTSSSLGRVTRLPPRKDGCHTILSLNHTPTLPKRVHMNNPQRAAAGVNVASGSASYLETLQGPVTPPPQELHKHGDDANTTPKKLVFPSGPRQSSPFRTPARSTTGRHPQGYDPYDPNTLLANELAHIRNVLHPPESPGGFFGKEGRSLLYNSPSKPGWSDWRFMDEF